MGVVEFDNTTFEINKPKKTDIDYHPSFAWTVKAKIKGIYQPTNFQKSYDVTKSYTKYNQSGPEISVPTSETKESFIKSNVSSSAGSIPKVAKVSAEKLQKVTFKIEKQRVYKDNASGVTFLTKGYGGTFINIPRKSVTIKDTDGLSQSQKPLVEVTMDRATYNRQDQARKVVDGKESFVNELETIRGFESVEREQKLTTEEVYSEIGMTTDEVKAWKKDNNKSIKMPHPKAALEAANNYSNGDITLNEYNEIIQKEMPITPYTKVPKPATIKDVVLALQPNKVQKGIIGLTTEIKDGEKVSSRLDIPSYQSHGIYVDTIHGPKGKGVLGYGQTAVLKNVEFTSNAKKALGVAKGTQSKITICCYGWVVC